MRPSTAARPAPVQTKPTPQEEQAAVEDLLRLGQVEEENKRAYEEHVAEEKRLEEERRLRPGTPGFESVTVESVPLSEEEFDFSTMPMLED